MQYNPLLKHHTIFHHSSCSHVLGNTKVHTYHVQAQFSKILTQTLNTVLYFLGCVRLGNLNLDFKNPDFGFAIEREIWNRISTLRYLFLDFHFYHLIGKSEKGFEKWSLRTAVLHAHAYLAKRRPLFTRIVLQILFWISQSNGKKEVHEIRIWISQLKSTLRTDFSEVKSGFRFWKSKFGFPNQTHP